MKKKSAILVVSFGTSYNDSLELTIGAIERAVAQAFPECDVRRAFTSQVIINILKERDGQEINNVTEALDEALRDQVSVLIVQPTHLMNGLEYMDLVGALKQYESRFERIILGQPLLSSEQDYEAVIAALTDKLSAYDDGKTAICLMGHGTTAKANDVYGALQKKFMEAGFSHYYIGTVEAEPTFDDALMKLKSAQPYKRIVLEPLMVVAGDHANNDMAGEEETSWKSILERKGYQVVCLMEGLGQIPAIRDIYVNHIRTAIECLNKKEKE